MTKPRSVYAERLGEYPEVILPEGVAQGIRRTWGDFFVRRTEGAFSGQIVLDVGCFNAAYLAAIAANHPATAFVGIDWKYKAIFDGGRTVSERGLKNLVLMHGRGREIGRWFGERELAEVWVLHPDPCDGPKELKNRLVAGPFMLEVARVLRPGGLFTLKTDHAEYFAWARGVFGVEDRVALPPQVDEVARLFQVSAMSADYWADAGVRAQTAGRPYAGQRTHFEERFIRRRQPIHFLEAHIRGE
jgi:tRNA G46 methylase TrmB